MIKKSACFLIIVLYLVSSHRSFAEKSISEEPDFNEKWRQASNLVVFSPNPEEGIILFKELLSSNPDEWLIYDVYAESLRKRGDFGRSIRVYKRALSRKQSMADRKEEIRRRIKDIEDQKIFAKAMQKALPWDKAQTFGTADFIIKTNVPQEFYLVFLQRISDLYGKEKGMLEKIFDLPSRVPPGLNIFLFGRSSEYEAFARSELGQAEILSPAYYNPAKKTMAVYCHGNTEWILVAELMAFYLLEQLYVPEPSLWLGSGLQQYIAYRLEKENAKARISQWIEFLNWLYNQGEWQDMNDLFSSWVKYQKGGALDKALQAKRKLDVLSWAIVHYFLEGGSAQYGSFFKEYLKFEMEDGIKTYASVQNYFEEHLSKEEMQKLSNDSIRYALSLNYDKA